MPGPGGDCAGGGGGNGQAAEQCGSSDRCRCAGGKHREIPDHRAAGAGCDRRFGKAWRYQLALIGAAGDHAASRLCDGWGSQEQGGDERQRSRGGDMNTHRGMVNQSRPKIPLSLRKRSLLRQERKK